MRESMVAAVELACSRKAHRKPLTARRKTGSGVVTSTAPRVPPSTIRAAVACATSWILPFSSSSPPMMPVSRLPERCFGGPGGLRSGFGSGCHGSLVRVLGFLRGSGLFQAPNQIGRVAQSGRIAGGREDAPPEFDNTPYHFFGGLTHPQNLSGGQRNHGIRRHVDMFDQIGVQNHGSAIQASQPDHGLFMNLIGGPLGGH